MKNYRTLFSYSFQDYGDHIALLRDNRNTPIFIGNHSNNDMAEACRVLAAEILEVAHQFEHAEEFCAPEFDKEAREIQLGKVRKIMQPICEEE